MSHEQAATRLRELLTEVVVGPLAGEVGSDRHELRGARGLPDDRTGDGPRRRARIEPLASADADTVAATVGPTVERYLSGLLDRPAT